MFPLCLKVHEDWSVENPEYKPSHDLNLKTDSSVERMMRQRQNKEKEEDD